MDPLSRRVQGYLFGSWCFLLVSSLWVRRLYLHFETAKVKRILNAFSSIAKTFIAWVRSNHSRFRTSARCQLLLLAVALSVSSLGNAQNGPTTLGPVQLTIPEGFEFAKSGRQDAMEVSAWTKGVGSTGTLLQVSIVDMGSQLETVPTAAQLTEGTDKYLQEFLGAVERRRTEYALSPVRHLTLAGQPASSAVWTGKLEGMPTVGVMYCVMVKRRYIVSFHTQSAGDAPTAAMRQAMKAFEAAKATPP